MLLKTLAKFSVFIFLLQVLFVRGGNAIITLPFNFSITDEGIYLAFLVSLRLLAATMPLALMLSITQMNDLSNVLVLRLGIPYKYAFTLTTAMRFIPIFAGEMSGIMEAQASRGVELDTKNFCKKMRLILPLCVPLLITSVKKIEGSAIAAEIRGFNLRTKNSCYKRYPIGKNDIMVVLVSVLLLFAAFWSNNII
jgi:energy-coupling factor transport system permease protein